MWTSIHPNPTRHSGEHRRRWLGPRPQRESIGDNWDLEEVKYLTGSNIEAEVDRSRRPWEATDSPEDGVGWGVGRDTPGWERKFCATPRRHSGLLSGLPGASVRMQGGRQLPLCSGGGVQGPVLRPPLCLPPAGGSPQGSTELCLQSVSWATPDVLQTLEPGGSPKPGHVSEGTKLPFIQNPGLAGVEGGKAGRGPGPAGGTVDGEASVRGQKNGEADQ